MSEELDAQFEEAKQNALDVEDGSKSKYWKILERKISGWLRSEQKHLEIMNFKLLRNPEEIEERNDVVKRVALLKQFLSINQTIIDEQLTVVDSLSVPLPKNYNRNTNFVTQ